MTLVERLAVASGIMVWEPTDRAHVSGFGVFVLAWATTGLLTLVAAAAVHFMMRAA